MRLRILGLAGLLAACFASPALADSKVCREWQREHRTWKTEAVRLYLKGAPQRELDNAIFELLQRESYLTSCDLAVPRARDMMLGWRLVGRTPDEYGSALMESVLESAGFDLAELFGELPAPAATATIPQAPAEP